jgi:hypothetical protein
MMIRDIAEIIIELESLCIYHADLAPRNIICICENFQYLSGNKNCSKLKDIQFKLIDFGDAYAMRKEICKIGKKDPYYFTENIFK